MNDNEYNADELRMTMCARITDNMYSVAVCGKINHKC